MAVKNLPLVKQGDEGTAVELIQRILNHIHLSGTAITNAPLTEDGDFGLLTKGAVIDFQNESSLIQGSISPDGIVGINTWKKLRLNIVP